MADAWSQPNKFHFPRYWRGRNGVWYQHAPTEKFITQKDGYLSFYNCVVQPHMGNSPGTCAIRLHVSLIENDDYADYIPNQGHFYKRCSDIMSAILELSFNKKPANFENLRDEAELAIRNKDYGVNT